tara:strand:- start:34 stop:774 length:741 start_codon:yes stop_codon:yes gene_type:complete
MNKDIKYKNHTITYHDLLTSGHNMDKFVIEETLYNRPDHNYTRILPLLHEGDVVYDIGAYIGTVSIPYALEGMRVYSFEGFPDNYVRLKKNCEPYDNIDVHLMAVSNENRTVETRFNDCSDQEPQAREINYRIFDEYVSEKSIPEPKFVKLDIEGMESLALFGMTNLVENVRPIWQIGYHEGTDISYEDYPGFVSKEDGGFDFDRLGELDYVIYDAASFQQTKMDLWGEYFCIPGELVRRYWQNRE